MPDSRDITAEHARTATDIEPDVGAEHIAEVYAQALLEVAEAQRLLLQAEIDEALSKLNVWRMQLSVATARGDLQPFLDAVK